MRSPLLPIVYLWAIGGAHLTFLALRTAARNFDVIHKRTAWQSSDLQVLGKDCTVTVQKNLTTSLFPADFVWGVGTSAGQVEGGADVDGRTPSSWDLFSQIPGKIFDGSNASVASDSYHKYKEDVELVDGMGVQSYRFSLSWSRLFPNGGMTVNPKGAEYYNNMIDLLVHKGIIPMVTLHHLDLPVEVDYAGGWLNSSIVERYTFYAEECFKMFGDRVKIWTTLNEPYHMAVFEYANGEWPPARCSDRSKCLAGNSRTEPYIAMHNMLLAHGAIVERYRTKYQGRTGGKIGINIEGPFYYPYDNSEASAQAVERAFAWRFGWGWEPLYSGDYPAVMREYVGSRLPHFTEREKALLKGSVDFYGLNFYTASFVREKAKPTFTGTYDEAMENDGHYEATFVDAQGNSIGSPSGFFFRPQVPQAMYDMLMWLNKKYPGVPIWVAENGLPIASLDSQGKGLAVELCDSSRVTYFQNYLTSVANAIRDGATVKGFYVWSLLDSWEWAYGYEILHGIVYVNFNDPKRTRYPRASYSWWQLFLRGKGTESHASSLTTA